MQPFSLNIKGKLHEFRQPAVMGILNVTPDSFYSGSRTPDAESVESRVRRLVEEPTLSTSVDILHVPELRKCRKQRK